MSKRAFPVLTAFLLLAACTETAAPPMLASDQHGAHLNHNSAAHAAQGDIAGWLNGEDVSLRYTKLYYCAEPPSSAAPLTDCEDGADAEVPPRGGNIPKIYAIVAAGIAVDPTTLSCAAGTPCLNHPAMIDLSRINGPVNAGPAPHSHILESRQAGWHQTVNIRVFNLALWNEIVAAKSIEKVRELQADPANAGKISGDTDTNIFFFLEVQR